MKSNRNHIETAMANHNLVFFIVAILVIFGIWALPHLNKDEFPQFTIRQGVIAAIYPGATAEEIELQVTQPLEEFLFTYSEIDKLKTHSETRDGATYIYVELSLSVDRNDEAWAKIRGGLSLFKATKLPAGVAAIAVIDDFGNTSSILLAIESDSRTATELEDYARQLARKLRTLPELGNCKIVGTQQEEIAVIIDPMRLSNYGISSSSLMANLTLQGFRTIGGNMASTNEAISVSIPYRTEQEVADQIVLSLPDGSVVHLGDVSTICRRQQKPKQWVEYNGKNCIILDIQMAPDNNIVAFGTSVDKIIEEARTTLPADLNFHRITDQPRVVNESVMSFMKDILLSIIVVIAVMLLLFPLRTALVACTGVPICTAATFGIMWLWGIELNTVTLAALIVVLGMIVDDSVIVVDGYTNLLQKGESRWDAATVSTKEQFLPMFVATCSISAMFFPMTHIITGPLGDFVQLFPWTILIALTASIFYAVWVTPYLSTKFIGLINPEKANIFVRAQERFFIYLQNIYQKLLTACFNHPWFSIGGTVALLILGFVIFTQLNILLMPKADRSNFVVEIFLREGNNAKQTAQVADSLRDILLKDKRVKSVTSFIGQSSPRFMAAYPPQLGSEHFAQLIVNTSSNSATVKLLKEYSRLYTDAFPDAVCRFKQLDYQVVKNPIEVYLHGDDYEAMSPIADSLMSFMASIKGTSWIHDDYHNYASSVKIDLIPEEAQRLGVTQTMLSVYLSTILGSQTLTTLYEGEHKIPVILYSDFKDSINHEALGDLLVPTAIADIMVPLRQVATLTPTWHNSTLVRWNSCRTITVGCDIDDDRLQHSIQKQVEKYVATIEPHLPDGVTIAYGGLRANNESNIPMIAWSVVAALFVMFLVLLYHYKKIGLSVLTISSSILTLFGAFTGLYVFNLNFTITAVLGIVALIGIIVRNTIMMYDYAEQLQEEKCMSVREAAFEAGLRRMRPVFLTSATTALGVIPMIIARTALWMPMGVVICLGTLFTLPLTLTFLPIIYWKIYE